MRYMAECTLNAEYDAGKKEAGCMKILLPSAMSRGNGPDTQWEPRDPFPIPTFFILVVVHHF
jgi:hypothetical protein